MKRKKHFYTVIALIAGVIILTTAAAANFENANGYNAAKSALKKMLFADNFTASLSMELIYNGTTQAQTKNIYMIDKGGEVAEYTATTEMEGDRRFNNETWVVRGDDHSEDESEYIRINRSGNVWNIYRSYSYGWMPNAGEDETTRKAVRFAELLADTFVGDLKNNFVLTSDRDGVKSYQIILSGNQLPEYVTAGISVLFSAAKQDASSFVVYDEELDTESEEFSKISADAWNMLSDKNHRGVVYVKADGTMVYFATSDQYYDSEYYRTNMSDIENVFRRMKTEPIVETAKCFITVDKEGRLLSITLEGAVSSYDNDGNKHVITLRISSEVKDHGTTVIDKPVIPENDTVYDYSYSSYENDYSYSVTENGVTRRVTPGKDEMGKPAELPEIASESSESDEPAG